jgi:hypothetical protein
VPFNLFNFIICDVLDVKFYILIRENLKVGLDVLIHSRGNIKFVKVKSLVVYIYIT